MADRITGALLLVVAAWYTAEARSFEGGALAGPVGPGAFPLFLGVVLGVLSLYLLLRPDPRPTWPHRSMWLSGGTVVASSLAYAYALVPLGFLVATTLELVVLGSLFRARLRSVVPAALALSLATFWLFDRLLKLPLPEGLVG